MNTDTVRFTGPTVRIPPNFFPPQPAPRQTLTPPPTHGQPSGEPKRPALPAPPRRSRSATSPAARRALRDIVVREVATRRDRDAFVKFPWRIYEGDANWAPPLLREAKAFLDRTRHPFYRHGEATQFLAYDQGQLVGRILVSDDPNYNAQHDSNQGCFGMFECINDQDVADALLNAAANWLRQRGRTAMMGPVDYSMNYSCGLLIDGFDTPQRVMMNHNPPYYARLLEGWRMAKAKDLYAWWFDDSCDMLHKWARRAERFAERGGTTVRSISFDDFDAEVQRLHDVYNRTWVQCWGSVKMTDHEFLHRARDLKKYAVADLILLAEVDGEPAGVCITLPDFNEATRPLNGRLTTFGIPIGLARLMYNLRKIQSARLVVLGIVDSFRRRGVAEMFILQTLSRGIELGYTGAELGWTLEDNHLINRMIEKVGGRRYKTFRIYETSL